MNKPKLHLWISLAVYVLLVATIFLLIAFAGFSTNVNMTLAILLVILSAGVSYATAKRRRS
ncbi:MAG TPA: hypothetical protein DCR44_03155 [Acholeplasmatales bacterium]|nr:MAG: hypothetical protein A2Y16_03820 [Tenericutes bacterium GWF2_57_13]HAQ56389.1 hypothetical protein [Acholeplasmatales bacterium]